MKIKEYLKNKIPENKISYLPSSFDVIGSICIIEINEEVKKYEKLIADTILKLNKNIKSVFKKISARKGKYRTYKLKFISGINNKETIYKENKVLFKLDVEKCYFSPRWSNERLRISKLVKKNEEVLVMFSGIGSFVFVILKNNSPKKVTGIELNKTAHKYALENVKLNKINETKISLLKGDVIKVMPKLKKFNRILMPLPKESENYLDLAIKKIKPKGTIHYYTFLSEEKNWNKRIKEVFSKHVKKFKILKINKCGVYAPRTFRVCADVKVL